MCVLAARGAVRLEHQFSGQSVLVPQAGEVALSEGQLDSLRGAAGSCQCEAQVARAEPPAGPRPPEVSQIVPLPPLRPNKPVEEEQAPDLKPAPKPPAVEEPVYKVLMPPLTFDFKSPAPPPDPSPEMIVLVRKVRVRPAVVFRGRVVAPPPPPPAPVIVAQAQPPPKPDPGVFGRIKSLFRRLTSR